MPRFGISYTILDPETVEASTDAEAMILSRSTREELIKDGWYVAEVRVYELDQDRRVKEAPVVWQDNTEEKNE